MYVNVINTKLPIFKLHQSTGRTLVLIGSAILNAYYILEGFMNGAYCSVRCLQLLLFFLCYISCGTVWLLYITYTGYKFVYVFVTAITKEITTIIYLLSNIYLYKT